MDLCVPQGNEVANLYNGKQCNLRLELHLIYHLFIILKNSLPQVRDIIVQLPI